MSLTRVVSTWDTAEAANPRVEFGLLGPVEARCEGGRIPLGRRRERCLLALLLLEPGRAVPMHRLVDLMWNGAGRDRAHRSVHTFVARLRANLRPYGVEIRTVADGYAVDVPAHTVDAERFRGAVASAPDVPDPVERANRLADALALWRGPVMADVAEEPLRSRVGTGLAELQLVAVEMKADADLARGRHLAVVTDLDPVVERHRTRERLTELRMVALYRSGRQVDALAEYRRTRDVLVDELGVEPGEALRRLQRQILAGRSSAVL